MWVSKTLGSRWEQKAQQIGAFAERTNGDDTSVALAGLLTVILANDGSANIERIKDAQGRVLMNQPLRKSGRRGSCIAHGCIFFVRSADEPSKLTMTLVWPELRNADEAKPRKRRTGDFAPELWTAGTLAFDSGIRTV